MLHAIDPLEEFRSKMCGHKRGYTTNREARRVRKIYTKCHGTKMDIYLCPFCGLHHLGHKLTYPRLGPKPAPIIIEE